MNVGGSRATAKPKLQLGAVLADPAGPSDAYSDIASAARYAESVGLDSLWAGDHLAMGSVPVLDCPLVLAAAAAVTERILIGSAVFVPSLRPLAWAAKQVATLTQLLGERSLQLGISVGAGSVNEYRIAGFAARDRAARTDAFLAALPDLLGGRATSLDSPDGPVTVQLAPAVRQPTLWIGGSADAAMERVLRHGDGWLAGLITAAEFADRARRLHTGAAHTARRPPRLGLVCHATFARSERYGSRDAAIAVLRNAYALDHERADHLAVAGRPRSVAEQLRPFVNAGAEHIAIISDEGPWERSCDQLAEVRAHLTA